MSNDEDYFNSVHDIESYVDGVVVPVIFQFETDQSNRYEAERYSIVVETFKVMHRIMLNNGWNNDEIIEFVKELREKHENNKPVIH
jgi:hypothetical protein